jgi:hypothetical protein
VLLRERAARAHHCAGGVNLPPKLRADLVERGPPACLSISLSCAVLLDSRRPLPAGFAAFVATGAPFFARLASWLRGPAPVRRRATVTRRAQQGRILWLPEWPLPAELFPWLPGPLREPARVPRRQPIQPGRGPESPSRSALRRWHDP